MTVTTPNDQLTETQLGNYAKLIYKTTGIRVSPQKRMLLSNRIRRRLKATGIESFESYYKHLQKSSVGDPEWDSFLQEITTHETYLFRDECQWKWFSDSYLPTLTKEASRGERKKELRVWSAACSTGDEAHTIASCIADRLTNCSQWKIVILGTDIGVDAVKKAQRATFSKRAMLHVPDGYRRRFFTQIDENQWAAKPVLTQWTKFQQHNLLDPIKEAPFDVIFLKNVLIYFDIESKQKALSHLCRVLRPGGVLVSGAADGVSGLLTDFERVTPWMHRKLESNSKRSDGASK